MTEQRLCTICARGGSKGVANKNLKILFGKPLLAYSIEQAKKTGLFSHVAISSDSVFILAEGQRWGADILIERPVDLATDQAPKLPVIQHAFLESEKRVAQIFSTIVDLDATSPLRSVDDIAGAVEMLEAGAYSNVITGAPARRSPYFNLVEVTSGGFVELSKKAPVFVARRQDVPLCYDMNASIYVWRRETLLKAERVIEEKTGLFVMPEERSLDIDSALDFEMVEFLLGRSSREVGRS